MRLPSEEITLPFGVDDIKLPPNRISDNKTINDVVSRYFSNFSYLVDKSQIVDNNLPFSETSGYIFETEEWDSSSLSFDSTDYKFVRATQTISNQCILILASSTEIDFYHLNVDNLISPLPLLRKYTKFRNVGNYNFRDIQNIEVYDDKLIIYDAHYQTVSVYDISAFTNNLTPQQSIKSIRQFTFKNGLIDIKFIGDKYYVATSDTIYRLNEDFNIEQSLTYQFNDIRKLYFSTQLNNLILIRENYDIYNVDINTLFIGELKRLNIVDPTLPILDLSPSAQSDRFFFISVGEDTYKVDSDSKTIVGYYEFDNRSVDHRSSCSISKNDHNDFFVLCEDRLILSIDNINLINLLYGINLIDVQALGDTRIEDLELEQDYVFNAMFQKLTFNTHLLFNSVLYKPVYETDEKVLKYSHLENAVIIEDIFNDRSNAMGVNETYSSQNLNRPLINLFQIQEKIKELITERIIRTSANTLQV